MDICVFIPHNGVMDYSPNILICDDEPILIDSVSRILEKEGYRFDTSTTGSECLKKAASRHYDIVLLDLMLPDISGQDVLKKLVTDSPTTSVVIITGQATLDNAVSTLKLGAADFIAKPFSPNELRVLLTRLTREIHLVRENELLRRRIGGENENQMIVGESKVMRELLTLADKVAPTDSTILILGESGTGKEIIARAIHQKSKRAAQEFVPIDCTSLVETLLESELFGHVKGSFTGAVQTKHGYFELAHGGTMFFDEVGNLPMSIQAKLLRVLQSRQFSPVGSTRPLSADVRILAATNQDLEKLIANSRFREDLFYRLNVVPISLPPLRRRVEDIMLLAEYFVERFNRRRAEPIRSIADEAVAVMQNYPWPGNVRELENTIERALILQEGDVLSVKSMPIQLSRRENHNYDRPLALDEIERRHLAMVLELTGQNRSQAAKLLRIDRKTLYNKIKKYGLLK